MIEFLQVYPQKSHPTSEQSFETCAFKMPANRLNSTLLPPPFFVPRIQFQMAAAPASFVPFRVALHAISLPLFPLRQKNATAPTHILMRTLNKVFIIILSH